MSYQGFFNNSAAEPEQPCNRHVSGAIARLTRAMKKKLARNAHKGGWRGDPDLLWYHERMIQEAGELLEAIDAHRVASSRETAESIMDEAADVANYAMMIADIAWHNSRKSG